MRSWHDSIDSTGVVNLSVSLPSDAEATSEMRCQGVDETTIRGALAARPDPARDAELWRILGYAHSLLMNQLSADTPVGRYDGWPAMPEELGPKAQYLFIWVYLAATESVRGRHRARGVSEEISCETLRSLGRAVEYDRRVNGTPGLRGQWRLPLVFSGLFFEGFGRLGFSRHQLVDDVRINGRLAASVGQNAVAVHIHDDGTPITPNACDIALANARRFFGACYGGDGIVGILARAWFFDDPFPSYVSTSSNLMRFRSRFEVIDEQVSQPEDWETLSLVFRRRVPRNVDLSELISSLPRDTSLEKACLQHLESGGHWHFRTAWLPF